MTNRLFHTIVVVGAALGASSWVVGCGGSEEGSSTADTGARPDSGKATVDTGWPSIAFGDAGAGDTWFGIRPYEPDTGATDTRADAPDAPADAGDAKDGGTDAVPDTGWPGISPVIDSGRP